ncbi:MAG: hypothetical protein HY900_05270 [Deltaproteobacteria bacterium]|nr:hypothetical protein [Deltaproteobacteria bacterium]
MRRFRGVLFLALLGMCFASCRKEPVPVRVVIHSAPQSLDPHLQNEVLTSAVLANLYDSLTEFDGGSGIRPALASEWLNPEERTWVFRLRKGVRFHDGRLLEAEDVVFSLNRARNHPGSGLASYLVEVESIRAIDAGTVEVRTRRPFAALLAKITPIAIVPRDAPETIVRSVGTGSYRLDRLRADGLDLTPVVDGWRKEKSLLPLRFEFEGNPRRRVEKLLAGEAEIAADLSEDAVGALRASSCCREEILPGSTVEYLRLSPIEPPFRDHRVRQAIDLALDRPAYIASAHHGMGQAVGQLVVPGVFGFAPDLKATPRDVPRARRLLAEAGYPGGFEVVLEYRKGRRGDLVAAQLAEAGVRVELREMVWTDLHPRLRRGEVGFYLGGVVAQSAEASDVLDGFVHTRDEARGYGVTNHARYSNPKADVLIEAAAASLDMIRRRELLQDAMRLVMADLNIVPIAGLYEVYGVRKGIRFVPRLDGKFLGREILRR